MPDYIPLPFNLVCSNGTNNRMYESILYKNECKPFRVEYIPRRIIEAKHFLRTLTSMDILYSFYITKTKEHNHADSYCYRSTFGNQTNSSSR
jgi:hypothetical protein